MQLDRPKHASLPLDAQPKSVCAAGLLVAWQHTPQVRAWTYQRMRASQSGRVQLGSDDSLMQHIVSYSAQECRGLVSQYKRLCVSAAKRAAARPCAPEKPE